MISPSPAATSARSPRRPRALPLIALLVALAALAGCSGSSTTAGNDTETPTRSSSPTPSTSTVTETREPPQPPPPPEVGECRLLEKADTGLFSNDTPTVGCKKRHTAYTFAVEELPEDITFEGVDIDNEAIQAAAAGRCTSAFNSFIGGSQDDRAMSRLTVTYFLADQTGFDRGAHWVRCDVIAFATQDELAELPRDVENILDDEDAAADFQLCANGEPASGPGVLVTCSQPHTYQTLAAIRLGKKNDDFPGRAVTREQGEQDCVALVEEELGVSGGYSYAWTYPIRKDWASGQRYGYCWVKS